jgi:hypothetical protein
MQLSYFDAESVFLRYNTHIREVGGFERAYWNATEQSAHPLYYLTLPFSF